jgi:phosphatidylserine/phosphatidylglycerophosphate/cardiolipin synthase-like enzyme
VRRGLALLALALATACAGAQPAPRAGEPAATARVEAYFTPGDDIARVISGRIDAARRSVQVQAYLFTNRRIAAALAKAARRGVAVELVADARQHEAGGLPVVKTLDRAGVRIWLAGDFAAFHNKVVLVDAGTPSAVVVTGSFNFTQAAQDKNAENVVVISGSPEVTERFARDFERHRARASRLQ